MGDHGVAEGARVAWGILDDGSAADRAVGGLRRERRAMVGGLRRERRAAVESLRGTLDADGFDRIVRCGGDRLARERVVPMTTRVFVYGSLLSGEPNHPVLGRSALVGPASTEPRFTLHDLGAFPALVAKGAQAVAGEVYEVDRGTLADLDRLEGHPRFYRRTPIALADGTIAEAYLLADAQVEGQPIVASGDWRAHRRERSS